MRTFIFTDQKSNKFWNIDLQGTRFIVTYGKVGSKGQTQIKDFFADAAQARQAHDKLIAEKLKKGYVETTARESPPAQKVSPVQQSLEAALVEDPDNIATQSVYADYLMDQGNPRGEFIQVQLALEDPKRSAKERTELRKREKELLRQHEPEWLGDLSRFLVGKWSGPDKPYHYQFARGWLDLVRVLPFPNALIDVLARVPEARLLRQLEVVYDMRYHPFDFDQFTEGPRKALAAGEKSGEVYDNWSMLPALIESPFLTNLRVFKMGFSDTDDRIGHSTMVQPFEGATAEQVIQLLAKCPRLEELYLNTDVPDIASLFALPTLGNLRVLQYYYALGGYHMKPNSAGTFPLTALAKNPSLQKLTTLRLHPGRDATIELTGFDAILRSPHLKSLTHLQVHMTEFGDEGCHRIIDSGILRRLKVLDIGYGNMTNAGALLLAGCPDLKHLEMLDVSRNALTVHGIAALGATGIQVIADEQHDVDERDYLYEVDFE